MISLNVYAMITLSNAVDCTRLPNVGISSRQQKVEIEDQKEQLAALSKYKTHNNIILRMSRQSKAIRATDAMGFSFLANCGNAVSRECLWPVDWLYSQSGGTGFITGEAIEVPLARTSSPQGFLVVAEDTGWVH